MTTLDFQQAMAVENEEADRRMGMLVLPLLVIAITLVAGLGWAAWRVLA